MVRHCQEMMTLMLIILLAWFPLSLPLAMLVGKCIKLGSGAPDARPVSESGASHRPQKSFRERASA